ncbi:MAG: sulfatase-like hydrolase/transferase, partial [Betaproteobacteria bacterium]
PPMKPPHGQHYERWYHMNNGGDERTELYWKRLPPDTGAIETWNSALPVAWHNSTWVGNQTIDYLQQHRDRPFCLWASFADPHHPFDCPEPWSRLHDPADVELPFNPQRDFERRPWWHRESLEGIPKNLPEAMIEHRKKITRLPAQTEVQLRAMIANYYGMIALVDHNVGRILIALDELGLADNTLVIFTSDHGEWLGDHGLRTGCSASEDRRRPDLDDRHSGDDRRLRKCRDARCATQPQSEETDRDRHRLARIRL